MNYIKVNTFFIKKIFHKVLDQAIDKHIYIFLFFAIWFCLDTNFDNILALKQEINFKNISTSARAIAPFILFFIFIITLFNNKKKTLLKKNKNFYLISTIFLFFFISQFPGLIFTQNNISLSYYLIMSLISIIVVFYSYNKNYTLINYQISFFVLFLLITIYGLLTYIWFYNSVNLNFYGTYPTAYIYMTEFSSNVIRSSGLARSAMILIIPLILLMFIQKINKIYLIYFLFLSSLIYLTQSRVVILFYLIFVLFLSIFYLRKKNLKYQLSKLFILILLPIIFSNLVIFSKELIRTTNLNKIIKSYENKILNKNNLYHLDYILELHDYESLKFEFYEEKIVRKLDPKSFSSNRLGFWKEILSTSNRPILGYGVLGDKFLINKNSSNAFIYSFASGGIIAVFLLVLIFMRYTFLSIKLIFIDKLILNKKNLLILTSIFTLSFLMYRSIAEVGIAVFSIDFLVFLSCIGICEKFINQK